MRQAVTMDIPLFASLSPYEQHHVLDCMSPLELLPGVVFVHEGDPGDSMYIITSGEIEFIKALGTPEEHILSVFQVGEIFGEVALLDTQGRRSASARARCRSNVLQMTAADFHQLIQTRPALAYQMAQIISNRLRAASDATIRDLEAKNRALAQAYDELQAAHEQIVEKEKLEKELEVACQIQHSMLPKQLPEVEEFTFGAHMQAARQVGGDFYDLFPLDDGHIAIVVGDVCDKGVPSALFMALTRSLVRAEALRLDTPANTLRRVNILLQDMSTSDLFVTVLYGVLDLQARRFTYARAGHELPILLRADGNLPFISHANGMLMGMFPEILLDEASIEFFAGDMLLLYSDGATDASDPLEQMFGRERLAQVMQASQGCGAQVVCNHILSAILAHQQTAPQFDDITLVTICANSG
jgi:phosphoserine phosphatase RsbU/P